MVRDSMRRRFLGGAATVFGVSLAGCLGGSAYAPETNDEGTAGADGESSDSDDADGGDAAFDGWFDDVENYDGVVDRTGQSEVTVSVGAQGNGGGFAFDPAAIRVDTGTTVTWEWTGAGGSHDVVATDDSFGSDLSNQEGHTFSHTFDTSGSFTYRCTPHESMGMKGAIVVE